MKTVKEFSVALLNYFGEIPEAVLADIMAELEYVKPGDLARLLRQIKITTPANFTPDLKAVVAAIRELKLDLMADRNNSQLCPVCNSVWRSSGSCYCCGYGGAERDGTPEEHRAWWERWKAGLEPRFSAQQILEAMHSKLNQNHLLEKKAGVR